MFTGLAAIADAAKSFAQDLIGGVYFPRIKISFGGEDVAIDVDGTHPLPVTLGLTDAQLRASAVAVVFGAVPAVTVNGSVAVTGTFWQTTQPVSGTFWQATQPVSQVSQPLPTGAASEATLAAASAKLPTLISGRTPVDGSGVTQPISVTALPLPTGAATSAGQATAAAAVAATAAADSWAAVTPSDTVDLGAVPKALYIGGAGNIRINGSDGTAATFAVLAGQTVPLRARRVLATLTTATGIVALY